MKEHHITIEPSVDLPPLYRWVCSCGSPPGDWKTREFQARIGGSKHVAIKVSGR